MADVVVQPGRIIEVVRNEPRVDVITQRAEVSLDDKHTDAVIQNQNQQTVITQKPTYVELTTGGPQGPRGVAGGETFVFTQNNPAAQWDVAHGMGQFPSVTVVDSAGDAVLGRVEYVDENLVRLHFSAPFSGKAYLNA